MDTPGMLRGEFYSTHLWQRCPNFHPCMVCKRCRNFCRHNAACVACENRKNPPSIRLCACTESTLESWRKLSAVTKDQIFRPNRSDKQGAVSIADTSKMEFMDEIIDKLHFGET